jgi:hypothetical protein
MRNSGLPRGSECVCPGERERLRASARARESIFGTINHNMGSRALAVRLYVHARSIYSMELSMEHAEYGVSGLGFRV